MEAYQYNIRKYKSETELYESTGQVSKIEGVNQATISRWCKNNKTANGYSWSY